MPGERVSMFCPHPHTPSPCLTFPSESAVEEGVGGDFPGDVGFGDRRIGEELAGDVEVLRPLAPLNDQRLPSEEEEEEEN